MKKIFIRGYFFLLFFCLQVAHSEKLSFVGCSVGGQITLRYNGRVFLNSLFIDTNKSESENIHEAINLQIKYISGYFYNTDSKKDLKFVLGPDYSVKITQVIRRNITYPFQMTIDAVKRPDVQYTNSYVNRAIEVGKTTRQDPALYVEYVAVLKVAFCGETTEQLDRIDFSLPLDPYLFYWHVPARQREFTQWRSIFWIANPCSTTELADFPDPLYFWYFWKPTEKGCFRWLREGKEFFSVRGDIIGIEWPDQTEGTALKHALQNKEEIKVTAIFGIMDSYIKESEKQDEIGLRHFQEFTEEMAGIIDNPFVIKTRKKNTLLQSIKGRLHESGKKIHLTTSFGPTDIFSNTPAEHWTTARNGLQTDDLVIYAGHSGLGENMSVENIEKHTNKKMNIKELPDYQLVAFLSCYTYTYFGLDLVERYSRAQKEKKIDLLFTGSSYTSGKMAAYLISYLDSILSPHKLSGGNNLTSQFLDPEGFLLIKNFHFMPKKRQY
jgi:hypothetical protein